MGGTPSPRAWGCFFSQKSKPGSVLVVPTGEGVFLRSLAVVLPERSRPHGRGGVSPLQRDRCSSRCSSPRAWGCFRPSFIGSWSSIVVPTGVGVFLLRNCPSIGFWVVPTGVGVFPSSFRPTVVSRSRPHGRGGVSVVGSGLALNAQSSPRAWGCFFDEGLPKP